MRTISRDQFVDLMSDALPELISSIMREDRSAISKGQVSVPQFWALHYISIQNGITVNMLAQRLNRCKSTTSALLRRLDDHGLIQRDRGAEDQRTVHLYLTRKGQRMIDELTDNRKQGIRQTYASLNAEERVRHIEMIEKILKNIRKTTGLVLLTALLWPVMSSAEGTNTVSLTLKESVEIGLKQSLAVVNAARRREIAQATKKRALADALPSLTGIADYALYDAENLTESGSRTVGAEASWKIFAGGRTLYAVRAAKAYQQLTAYQERQVRENQVLEISVAYYQVLLARTQVDVLEQSVRQLADFEADTRRKYEAGTASEFDWLSAKVALANEKPRLIAAQNSLSLALEQFRNVTYLDELPLELTDPLQYAPNRINLDEAIAQGLQKRPELLEKSSSINLREADVVVQRSDYFPNVNLYAGYNYYNPDPYSFLPGSADTGWQEHWNAGVRATWSLFDGGQRSANLSESKLNLAIEEDEYRDLKRSVELDIRTQWLRGRDATEVIEATTENVALAERALQIARSRFDAGLSTNLEVTQANLELSDARLARSQALHEYMVAVVRMKYAVGILLEEYEDE